MENKDIPNNSEEFKTIGNLIHDSFNGIEKALIRKTGITGVPCGFTELDRVTSGWQGSDLIILAGRPSIGKTAFALTIARNAAIDFKTPVAYFSLEMSEAQIMQRLISSETELSLSALRRGQLQDYEFEQLTSKVSKFSDAPMYIDSTPGLSLTKLASKATLLKEHHNIQMIIVDYIQLMILDGKRKDNREQEISLISRTLKNLAKDLNIPIIILSQLSRSVEQRGGSKRPQLSDLRDSGALEEDADIVMFVYRDDYYKMDEPTETPPDSVEIIIAKHRNGALDSVHLRFLKEYAKFIDEPSLSDYHL